MVQSDNKLRKLLKDKILRIDPLTDEQIQPASIDLRLSDHFLQLDEKQTQLLDLQNTAHYVEFRQSQIIIPPHSFLLASTIEYISLPPNLTAFVEGRSSIGRMGLFIQNAGWVDPGFEGTVTLELYNANRIPIKLEAGRRICQIVIVSMEQSAQNPYHGKYQGQIETTSSRIYQDK